MECQIVFSVSFILCAPHVAKQQGSAHFVTIKPDLWAKFLQGFVKKLVMTGSPCTFRLVWLISRIFSANEYYFSLTLNQPIVLSVMVY